MKLHLSIYDSTKKKIVDMFTVITLESLLELMKASTRKPLEKSTHISNRKIIINL